MAAPIFAVPRLKVAKVALKVLDGPMVAIVHVEHVQLETALVDRIKRAQIALVRLNFLLFHVQLQVVAQAGFVKGLVRTVLALENFDFPRVLVPQHVCVEIRLVNGLKVTVRALVYGGVAFHVGFQVAHYVHPIRHGVI